MVMPDRLQTMVAATGCGSGLATAVALEVGDGDGASAVALAGQAVNGAVSWLEGYAGISIERRTFRAWYEGPGRAPLALVNVGKVDADTLTVEGDAGAIGDAELRYGGLVDRRGMLGWGLGTVRVDYVAGWLVEELPADLRQAIVGLAGLYLTRRDRQPGVVTVDTGGVARLVFGDGNVPTWVAEIGERYRRTSL